MISAKVILHSVSPANSHLTTLEIVMPRFILAEFNTHRAFSRSSASSRAIPVAKQIEFVTSNPFVPEMFGLNQPGMQSTKALAVADAKMAQEIWLSASKSMSYFTKALTNLNTHKQWASRLLEPFMWQTVIVSATDWNGFFKQRLSEYAQPEMRQLAQAMKQVMGESEPQVLKEGEWHLPYIQPDEQTLGVYDKRRLSTARCARVSYLTHDGIRSREKDFELFHKLVEQYHPSPSEHVAVATVKPYYQEHFSNFDPSWVQYRKFLFDD